MDSIGNRLKALGVTSSEPEMPLSPSGAQPKYQAVPIEKVVNGQDHHTLYGDVFTVRTMFDASYRHGQINPFEFESISMISRWAKLDPGNNLDIRNLAFLDTETSGLAGGTGTFAFLVGIGKFEDNGFQVQQFFMRDPSGESALLAALDEYLTTCSAIVTFNGKTFDIPVLNSRYTLNGLSIPFAGVAHFDLLHLARRLWRDRLSSRALSDLENEIMSFYRVSDEVPGYLIPQYYFDYLKTGDASPLKGVFYHNAIDIMSLGALFVYCSNLLSQPIKSSVPSLDMAALGRIYEDLGSLEQAAEIYSLCLERGLPREFYLKTVERFASMRRKQNRLDLAAQLWMLAANQGDYASMIELAKYFEHHERDLQTAITWVKRAIALIDEANNPIYLARMRLADTQRRLDRLQRKTGILPSPKDNKNG